MWQNSWIETDLVRASNPLDSLVVFYVVQESEEEVACVYVDD